MRRTIGIAAIALTGIAVVLVAWMRTWAWQGDRADRAAASQASSPLGAWPSPLQLPPPLKGVTYSHETPAYGLPLVFQIDLSPVPDPIKGPSPSLASKPGER